MSTFIVNALWKTKAFNFSTEFMFYLFSLFTFGFYLKELFFNLNYQQIEIICLNHEQV